jgi:hypothetical protein
MTKVVRFPQPSPQPIPAPAVSSKKAAGQRSDRDQFVSIALFSGLGLLISLIAVLCGVTGVWF